MGFAVTVMRKSIRHPSPWVYSTASAVLVLAAAPGAQALNIIPIYGSSVTSLAEAATIESAFNTVAADFNKSFASPINVYINVSWGSVAGQSLPSNAVGASSTNLYGYYTYSQVLGALSRDSLANPSDTALATALKTMPTTAPSGVLKYVVPSAEAKALGLISGLQTSLDGSIGFAGNPSGYTFSLSGAVSPTAYDFSAVAAHEIEEVLGRISGISSTATPPYRTVFDLFRYSSPGVLNDNYNGLAYFSVDGGKTNLSTFNNSSYGGDRSDWQGTGATVGNIQDAFISKGERMNLTAVDLTALDVLGYGGVNLGDTSISKPGAVAFNLDSVPEPATWLTMLLGLGLTGAALRRRGSATVAVRG